MPSRNNMKTRLVEAFVVLQLVGCCLFVLIFVLASIAQHRGASRHLTFFSFCLAWIVFCVSYSLLTFAGQQASDVPPNHCLCIAQAALVYGAPPLAGSATVSLVTNLILNIEVAFSNSICKKRSALFSTLLVIGPWITWLGVAGGVLIFSLQSRQFVMLSRNGTFCVLVRTALPELASVLGVIASVILIAEEIVIAVLLYRNRNSISGFRQSVGMAIRVGIFTIAGIVAIVIAVYYVSASQRGGELDVLLATVPVFAAAIFGSQDDIVNVLAFWERHHQSSLTATVSPTTNDHTGVLTTVISSHEATLASATITSHSPTQASHGHELV